MGAAGGNPSWSCLEVVSFLICIRMPLEQYASSLFI